MSESSTGMVARLKASSVVNLAERQRKIKALAIKSKQAESSQQDIIQLQQTLQGALARGNRDESERIETLLETHYDIPRQVPQSEPAIEAHVEPVAEARVEPAVPTQADCTQLYDPCTREPIINGDITLLEKRVHEIKTQRMKDVDGKNIFPPDVQSRLDLLLFILNNPNRPDETLLNFTNSGQLYESYWDIVFSLGLLEQFPINQNFYMYNGKIETLVNIDGEGFMNQPLLYLSSKKINEGSKSGASDITFVYKKTRNQLLEVDECSSDPTIKVTELCSKDDEVLRIKKKTRPLFYFCSSKYFKSDATKGVDKFDIQNIYTAAKSLDQAYDRQIILLVKDKGAVEDKLRKAIRKYISEEASHVFGIEDLLSSLNILYDFVKSKHQTPEPITVDSLNTIFNFEHPERPILRLRVHQYLATYKICDAIRSFKTIQTQSSNKFLVGIVPRGGKTFIAGGIIDELQPNRVVVLLGAKSETLTQFKNDVFESFKNFSAYECIDVVESTDLSINPSKKYIFIMSIELYKQPISSRRLLQELKGGGPNRADLFICDEAHLKTTTARAVKATTAGTTASAVAAAPAFEPIPQEEELISDDKEISQLQELDKQLLPDVPVVYMTGTYMKPLTALKIPEENTVIWEYQDIQQAKNLSTNEQYFRDNFGVYYDRAIQKCISFGQTYDEIEKQYQKFPELYLLTTQFTPDAKDAFLKETSGGFPSLTHLFTVRADFNPEQTAPEEWFNGFTNPQGVFRLLNYLAPSTQISAFGDETIDPISSVLKSIDFIAQRIGDRLRFFTKQFVSHSQLWFLPHMQGHPLYKRMCALAGALFQTAWFRKYFHIVAVSSSIKWNIPNSKKGHIQIRASDGSDSCGDFSWICPNSKQSLKQCLLDQEANARQKGKGLIILAQNMLHLGISLPCVDIVVLLDTGEKVDERIQKMYRALTESSNKKGGYIIDMNYFRTVTAIMNYQITSTMIRSKQKKVVQEDIPNIFNKVLDIYSIDIDKPIFGTHEERMSNNSEIQKTTIPELEKVFGGKSRGDSIILEDAAGALNKNITNVMKDEYQHSYADFLKMLQEGEQRQQKTIREEGANVQQATYEEEQKEATSEGEQLSSYPEPKLFRPDTTEEDKRRAYVEIFKTTLKLAAFGTNSMDLQTFIETLSTEPELQQNIYEALIKRGLIEEDKRRQELQKQFIIDVIIKPGLQKMVDQDRNTSYSKMKETIDDDDNYPSEVQNVLKYIEKHLAPNDYEREQFGEIFTPMTFVNQMLDSLPEEVWTNKSLTWLDPANGMGNFPIAVFLRLFYGFRTKDGKFNGITNSGDGKFNPGLTKSIPNETARRKHIVKDMLYMVELNSKNIAISRNLFKKIAPGIEPNIIQMDRNDGYLANVDMKFPNNSVNNFDIIMGNPPFNPPKTDSGSSGNIIWPNFVMKSYTILNDKGYLLFVHPPGWKKPTDEVYNPKKFTDNFKGQIRQGQVWKNLKENGIFLYIYTNDQRSKVVGDDYLPHFPAVDYYVYQKNGNKSTCDTKNVFLGEITESKELSLNYNITYLPNLITKQTQEILRKLTSKEGDKPIFKVGFDPRGFKSKGSGPIKYIYQSNAKGPVYQYFKETIDNVNMSKVVINYGGGIDGFYCSYIDKDDKIGVLHMTMFTQVETSKEGKHIESFFNSDIVKFIFLITQYASGKNTKNEPLVANSITIPPEGIADYYKFFGIEQHKKYIEDTLEHYTRFKAPKRVAKTAKAKGGKRMVSRRLTRKIRR